MSSNSPNAPQYTPHTSHLTPNAGTKAMILAAGLGTRLRPITEDRPKCMVPLAGRPLLDWILRWLKIYGVGGCIINLHYYPEKVRQFVGDGKQYDLRVSYSYEPKLLGTAGAVKKMANFFADGPFYVIYGDNFSQWDIGELKRAYESHNAIATVAVHWREDVSKSGMVRLDHDNRILQLIEKPRPQDVTSHYVSAGFFYLSPKILGYIPDNEFCDFGFDVFPAMLKAGEKLYAVKMDVPINGIDTREAYKEANAWALNVRSEE